MIDYKHPIIVEMKGRYRETREAYELAEHHQRLGLGNTRQLFEDARTRLADAEAAFHGLMDRMRIADDVEPYEREYYVLFINSHLANITLWLQETQRRLENSAV